jgi:DNA-3-methyladenine glycosylase II
MSLPARAFPRHETVRSFEIVPRGPFSLLQAISFGFGPKAGAVEPGEPVLRLGFCVDGYDELAGVSLRQTESGAVVGGVYGARDIAAVQRQTARLLSLDHDGTEWPVVGERDPVIGSLQRAYDGFRPVLFSSPYEAAAWAIIATRRPGTVARKVHQSLAESLGEVFDVGGVGVRAFPSPSQLERVTPMPGIEERRAQRLRAVAAAALEGRLDPDRLRALGPDATRAAVQQIPGIGDFYGGLIAHRAVGFVDALNPGDPISLRCAAHFYGLDRPPTPAQFKEMAESWRPFRSWAVVLLRQAGYREGISHR